MPAGGPGLVVAGNFSLDDTVTPAGEVTQAPGGDALYTALGCAIWRYPVAILSRVGADYPPRLLQQTRRHGISTDAVRTVAGPTVHYRITNGPGGEREYEHLTPPACLDDLSPQGAELDAIRSARWLHVAAMPIEFQAAAIARSRELGIPYSLDPHEEYVRGFEDQLRGLIRGGLFAPSQLEAELLFPDLAASAPLTAASEAAGRLLSMGARVVIVKLGEDGSLIRDQSGWAHLPALPVPVLDTTGAGDAYCGGFLAAYLSTGSPLAGAVCGTVSAAHVISGFGAFHSPLPSPIWLWSSTCALLAQISVSQHDKTRELLVRGFPWLHASHCESARAGT